MKNIDYIIVGQGIAGSMLAFTLLEKKCSILVIDEEKENTSSKIAYGLCNPIVFKRLIKSFYVDEAFDFAREHYFEIQKKLDTSFIKLLPLFKIFNSAQQQLEWLQKANSTDLRKYLSKEIKYFNSESVFNKFGAGEVLNTFMLNTKAFLNAVKLYLVENASYRNECFDYDNLILEPDAVSYKGINAKKIIFCEGFKGASNPYFSWLPFNLCKGEKLNIKLNELNISDAISNNVVLIPDKKQYILGSTYSWDEMTEEPSQMGKEELIDKLRKITSLTPEIMKHEAAIRPTTIDRRPFVGIHPVFRQLAIFNGMGTKSVMLAPCLAKEFSDYLLNGKSFSKEIDIMRFIKKN